MAHASGIPTIQAAERSARPPQCRVRYLHAALAQVPRLLGSMDRNPYRPTYGCFDRQYWHYRTAAFPSEMYQEGVLPLALLYTHELPGNRWYREPRLREAIVAALRFSARAAHADGSCDDYYPYERALGAAVFSLNAAAEAYRLLALDDCAVLTALRRRAHWIALHGESGTLANHHALAALALERVARLTHDEQLHQAARRKVGQLLDWQSDEGWFVEYGGADPGYQSVTIDALAKLAALPGPAPFAAQLAEPLERAVTFAHRFLHPDGSYGGEYGSRGTHHFYPHGCELLAQRHVAAAKLADGFLTALSADRIAHFADDRMYVHRLGNLLEAYLDWSPDAPVAAAGGSSPAATEYLAHCQLLIDRSGDRHTVIAAARGGVVKHFTDSQRRLTDTGLVLETSDGRIAVSQQHDLERRITWQHASDNPLLRVGVTITGQLHVTRFETATPLKQAVLHLGMLGVGRWCRDLVRRLLQRRVITGRRRCPVTLSRTIELLDGSPSLRITDRITLEDPRIQVRRMSISSDLESAYVAASGVYQDAVLQPWTPLDEYVDTLNQTRQVTVVRTW